MRELLRLGWPIVVSMLSYSTMTLVDSLFVARLSASALAGVGLGGILLFALLCYPIGMLRGAKVLVSQARGAGRQDLVRGHSSAALLLGAGLGLLVVALGSAVAPLVAGLSAGAEAGQHAASYLRLRALAGPAALVFIALREARYGVGDSRTPMLASVSANLLNVALDYGLIFGLHQGVAGAAWASNVAGAWEAGVLLALHGRRHLDLGAVRPSHLAALWRVGLPSGLQFSLEVGSFALLAALISRYGDQHMAAHQLAMQVIHLSFLPGFALSDAASVLVGQAVGARRQELVRPLAHLCLAVVTAYMGACGLGMLLGGGPLAALLTPEPEVAAVLARLFAVAALFQVLDGANIVARSVLRGTGDVRVPAVVCIATSWLSLAPMMWWLGYRLEMGAVGGWIGFCVELSVGSAILWWRIERGGWRPAAAAMLAQQEQEELRLALKAPAGSSA